MWVNTHPPDGGDLNGCSSSYEMWKPALHMVLWQPQHLSHKSMRVILFQDHLFSSWIWISKPVAFRMNPSPTLLDSQSDVNRKGILLCASLNTSASGTTSIWRCIQSHMLHFSYSKGKNKNSLIEFLHILLNDCGSSLSLVCNSFLLRKNGLFFRRNAFF